MTPAEMCVLFSGDVLAFILVWFTNIAEGEQGGRRTKKVPDVPQERPEESREIGPDVQV